VRDITRKTGDATIVSAMIGMGNSLKLRVGTKGVGTREQLAFLQAEHCEEGQGFYFSPPVDAEVFAELLGAVNTEYAVNWQLAGVL
jgi:EAL domain-containing protein (putative c-di-GMP-specific phosphodiesterase class I)